jgi:hypothetical protein
VGREFGRAPPAMTLMTKPKTDLPLPPRPRSFPTADECAAELAISPDTWANRVKSGDAPPSIPGFQPPRWCWNDVVIWMTNPAAREEIKARYAGQVAESSAGDNLDDPFVRTAGNLRHASPRRRVR